MSCSAATAVSVSGVRVVDAGDRGHEALEPRGLRHDEHVAGLPAYPVAVRDPARGEQEVARAQDALVLGHVEGHLALQDVEALVLGVVDVKRRHVPGGHLDHVDYPKVAALREDPDPRAEEDHFFGCIVSSISEFTISPNQSPCQPIA
jgi:hypothetical protein